MHAWTYVCTAACICQCISVSMLTRLLYCSLVNKESTYIRTYSIRGTFDDDFNLAIWRIYLKSPN